MKYYYLINGKIMSANEKMPRQANKYVYIGIDYINWKNSLQPCEISESELMKIKEHLTFPSNLNLDNIEVTDIISDNNGVITFKQPKQVEEIEAVELIKYLDECIESCNKRLNDFKTGKMDYSYYGSMAMMSAYNNVKQFIKERNNGK